MAMSFLQYESYDAVTARLRATLDKRYKGLTLQQEQRRLRIHLRHFLLSFDQDSLTTSRAKASSRQDTQKATKQGQNKSIHPQNDTGKARVRIGLSIGHVVALKAFTRLVRRRLRLDFGQLGPLDNGIDDSAEYELPSISTLVPLGGQISEPALVDRFYLDMSDDMQRDSVAHAPTNLEPPYQVRAELFALRDLLLNTHSPGRDVVFVSAEISFKHASTRQLAHLVTPRCCLSASHGEQGVAWDDQQLVVGIDPADLTPEETIADCTIQIHVWLHTSETSRLEKARMLGKIAIELELLETPLAEQYSMVRWFPLERPSPGATVRGDARVGVQYLTRTSLGWEAYQPPNPKPPPSPQLSRPKTPERRQLLGQHRTSMSKPPLSPHRQASSPQCRRHAVSPPRKPPRSPQRIARVEAMSPPSSPSSYYSSDNNDEDTRPPARMQPQLPSSPPRRRSLTMRGIATSKTKRPGNGLHRQSSESDEEDQAPFSPTSTTPKKPFLRRKPYKVVFQKLDWSRVGSKTDSNWGKNQRDEESPPKPSGTASATASLQANPDAAATKSSVPETLLESVFKACHVTQQTASLAQMKYRSERTRFLRRCSTATTEATKHYLASEASMQSLWKELHGDSNGNAYVRLLQDFVSSEAQQQDPKSDIK